MHETAQVAAFICSFLTSACLSELFRCMPQSEDDTETPTNWNTLFNYGWDCQRVEVSLSQSSNVSFVLFISVALGCAEDDALGKGNALAH